MIGNTLVKIGFVVLKHCFNKIQTIKEMQNTFKCNAVAVSLNQLCKDKRCRKPTGI